jgi:ubiquitin-protein ligase
VICADALQGKWSPTLTLHSLLPRLSSLLDEPNTVSMLNAPAGDLYKLSARREQYWAHVYLTHERNMDERLDAH